MYESIHTNSSNKLGNGKKEPNAINYKILLVEDSSAVQNITKQILNFYKYEVDFASNGKEGLEMIDKGDYDAILLDLSMPVMGGLECLKEIRKLNNKKKANVPVIAFTGNADFYTRVELKNLGFDDYIEKPCDYIGIDTLLNKHILEYHRLYN